jgi:diguanylate cyclase (GGDEF)-like protein
VLYAGWQVFRWPSTHRELFGDVFFYPVDIAAIATAWAASRRCRKRRRLRSAWRLLAAAFLVYLLGDIVFTVYEAIGSKPYPSLADVFYLAFYPLMLWGVLRFPSGRRSPAERVRLGLDLLIVAIGGTAVVTYFVLGPTIADSGSDPLEAAISIAYPVGDVVLMVGLGSVLLRGSTPSSIVALRFLAAGLLFFVAGDLVYGYLTIHSTYQGGDPVDSLWMAAVVVFALAGAAQSAPEPSTDQLSASELPRASWAPFVAIAVSYGLLLGVHGRDRLFPDATMLFAAVLVATLVSARQFLAQRDLVRTQRRLSYQSLHDSLTGLPNRALAVDRAEQMLLRARRSLAPVAALYVDIDGFKRVNDSFGHATGDELLRVVATRLAGAVRTSDTVARLGGDEFLVLLDASTFDAGPELAAERIATVLSQPVRLHGADGRTLSITASIGIAVGPQESAAELIRNADFALYEAKTRGKNRWVVFESSMQTAVSDRLELELDLKEALRRDQFFLHYQPIVELQGETIVAVEALIRWEHPTRGIVSPATFIPLAEQTGLILPVGRWVLAAACAQTAAWQRDGHDIGISVNVSPSQIDQDGFVTEVADILASTALRPETLTLEITETALMRDSATVSQRLTKLKALGVEIAIDDFGTGYSSLAYLRQLPVDVLKIDRSFIASLATSPDSQALVHTLVELGKALRLHTLAEGIEDRDQLRQLQSEDCDFGQGFLLGRPADASAVERLLSGEGEESAPDSGASVVGR